MIEEIRTLTPMEYTEIHRYQDKAKQILAHVRTALDCRCGERVADDEEWAYHLATVLFPRGASYDR